MKDSGQPQLFCREQGTGEPLLLLGGLGCSSRHWLWFLDLMANRFHVLAPDNRGMGRSVPRMREGMSIGDFALDAIELLDAEGIPRCHVVGHSLGGMIGLAMGISYRSRVKSLTIINSSVSGMGLQQISWRAALFFFLCRVFPRARNRIMAPLLLPKRFGRFNRDEVVGAWDKILLEEGPGVTAAAGQLSAALTFFVGTDLAKMTTPTMIIAGTKDRLVPNANSLILHRFIPGSQLVEIEGGHHELALQFPERIVGEVVKFTSES